MQVANAAMSYDVHVVGVSSQAAAHRTLVPRLIKELHNLGMNEVLVVCGGIIPPADLPALLDAGAAAVFGPGTPLPEASLALIKLLQDQQGTGDAAAASG
eukprot:TRINITY_DN13947_c0_g1_i4.p2 TRINITY_DN13947_c0_g1~~TRINITY_DN13947_c0_g1_i4.p2  ORF type:complete len:100 (+),score=18.09 TRINITY_DN13947_c0_g1_i4:100-399(+)